MLLSRADFQYDFILQVAKGQIEGHSQIFVFGHSENVRTTETTLWDQEDLYIYLTADTTLYLSSSDNSDTQPVLISGLNDQFEVVQQLKTLTGQTPVALDTDIFRVIRMNNAGSTDFAGDIYLSTDNGDITAGVPNTAANIKAKINAGRINITRMGIFTVPAGFTLFVSTLRLFSDKDAAVELNFSIRPEGGVFLSVAPSDIYQDIFEGNFGGAVAIGEKSDVELSANSTNEGGNNRVSGAMDGILVNDKFVATLDPQMQALIMNP